MKIQKSKGFTLIELLVVVAIIGVLATIVLSSLSDARARARDANRLADIRTIQTALEVYYLDNGKYPTTDSWAGSHTSSWDTLNTLMETTLPVDPVNDTSNSSPSAATTGNLVYGYYGSTSNNGCSGQAYYLIFNLESRMGDGPNDGIEMCNNFPKTAFGDTFTVGVDKDGKFITPDTSGTLRE
jgi:general secretion pathway protein G